MTGGNAAGKNTEPEHNGHAVNRTKIKAIDLAYTWKLLVLFVAGKF